MTTGRARIHNQRFAQMCLARILAKPNHLLSFLVEPGSGRWLARSHGSDVPSMQVGHAESLHAGGPERLFLEDADFNPLGNWRGERQGAIFRKSGVLIDGIPVELRTARMWESLGCLPKGTVARAPMSEGWKPV